MKITANLEFDTFGEAEKVFRHLGLLDADADPRQPEPSEQKARDQGTQVGAAREIPGVKSNSGKPLDAKSSEVPVAATAAEPTLDDVKTAFRDYVARGGGRTVMTARAILAQHGIDTGRLGDARPEQFAVLKRAFETAGPDMPLGEGA